MLYELFIWEVISQRFLNSINCNELTGSVKVTSLILILATYSNLSTEHLVSWNRFQSRHAATNVT